MIRLHDIARIKEKKMKELDVHMQAKVGISGVRERLENTIQQGINSKLGILGLSEDSSYDEVHKGIFRAVQHDEEQLYKYVGIEPSNVDFQKITQRAREMSGEQNGFFLKKECARKILEKRPPETTMKQLGYSSVEEMLSREDIMDVFSALRFTESTEWMHKTFDDAYSRFTANDFEKRAIEIRVLGDQWKEVAEKFVAKKHHNVSHLKEFGVIFVNPIAESAPGKFLRDFALLLHYTHEIVFYSKLFERYIEREDFNERFLSLLRGDVPRQPFFRRKGEWLIIQRYLWKENPNDKRLFAPRVNPESLHWRKAQQDIVALSQKEQIDGFSLWDDSDYLAAFFPHANELGMVSFDMEDSAMSFVAHNEQQDTRFIYHQQEALWNKIFASYVGGYDRLEEYILDFMDRGRISL